MPPKRSERGDRDRVEHMLRAGRDAVSIAAGRSRSDLNTDIIDFIPPMIAQLEHALDAWPTEEGG